VGELEKLHHKYWSWYYHYHDGRREGPMLESNVPWYVFEVAFGKSIADLEGGAVNNVKDPKLEESESSVYSADSSNEDEDVE